MPLRTKGSDTDDSLVEIQFSDTQLPTIDDWLPIHTYNGIKWVPTIPYKRNRTCLTCPVYAECAADIARGDFAWCEDVIPADFALTPTDPTIPTLYAREEHDGRHVFAE